MSSGVCGTELTDKIFFVIHRVIQTFLNEHLYFYVKEVRINFVFAGI